MRRLHTGSTDLLRPARGGDDTITQELPRPVRGEMDAASTTNPAASAVDRPARGCRPIDGRVEQPRKIPINAVTGCTPCAMALRLGTRLSRSVDQ